MIHVVKYILSHSIGIYKLGQCFYLVSISNFQKMDVAAFSGDNFDAKDWINKALKSSEPGQSKVGVGGWTCPCF